MDGKAIALLGVVGLGALALGGGSRRSSGGGGESAARRKLAATDAQARAPGFVPGGQERLTGEARIAGLEDAAAVEVALVGDELALVATPSPALKPNHREARRLAGPLSRALRKAEPGPLERDDVRAFQRAAALIATGLYDAATRDALARYGIRNAPAPWFTPTPLDSDGGQP